FIQSPTEAFPRTQALAVWTARRGRSSGLHASKSGSKRSAQSAAQVAKRWCLDASSGPPRWTATNRLSRITPPSPNERVHLRGGPWNLRTFLAPDGPPRQVQRPVRRGL